MTLKTGKVVVMLTVVLTAASFSMGSMLWDFSTGAQGWTTVAGGAPVAGGNAQNGYYIYDNIENGGGANCGVMITGLNEEILSTGDYIDLLPFLASNPNFPHAAFRVEVSTAESGVYYASLAENSLPQQFNLFDLTLSSGPALAVGDHVSGITVLAFGYSLMVGNGYVELVSVPEPTTMAVLGIGGLSAVLMRRKQK